MENGLKDSTLTRPKVSPAVEEAVKRNTDCVYFLASPLTCKKGIDCEYRHSEAVRVNPRDCYYWLTNTCLNPKCAFRHPPLDVGTPKTPTTPALPTESPSTSQIPPAHPSTTPNSSKQRIPCFYFKKGMCLKGDNCFFMHGPLPVINPISQKIPDAARAVTVNTQTFKMPSWSLNNSASQQNSPNTVSVQSPTAVASAAKSVKKAENFSAMSFPVKNNLVPKQLDVKIPPKSHNENKSAASNTFYRRPFANNIHKGREPEKSVDKYSPVLNAQNHYTSDDDEVETILPMLIIAQIIPLLLSYINEIRRIKKSMKDEMKLKRILEGERLIEGKKDAEIRELNVRIMQLELDVEMKDCQVKSAKASAVALGKQMEGFLLEYNRLLEENQILRNELKLMDRRFSHSYSKKLS